MSLNLGPNGATFTGPLGYILTVGSVVEWLKRRASDRHGLGLTPIRTILLCPWKSTLRDFPLLGGLDKQF